MRPLVPALVALAVASSGCILGGGCYTSSYSLAWHDPAVAEALRERAGPGSNVTVRTIGPGLPADTNRLPVTDGNASLASVTYSWPAETPEMDVSDLDLRPARDGNGTRITGIVDAHLGRARFAERVDVFLAGILADPADAPPIKRALLDSYAPGAHDFSDLVQASVAAPLALDGLLGQATWVPHAAGTWEADLGDWRLQSDVTQWSWWTGDGHLQADAAGHVVSPAVRSVGDDHASPGRDALEAEADRALAALGLPPAPVAAQEVAGGRTCAD